LKVFVTGVGGQLGYDVVNELKRRGYEALGSDITESADIKLDITDKTAVETVLNELQPDAVIHCAAWTAVDAAEDEENKEKVYAVNVTGTRNIAEVCKQLDCEMIYISTDYVFNGVSDRPWVEDDEIGPISVYGKSKLMGEEYIQEILDKYFIVRTAWLYGINGRNFPRTMLELAENHSQITVVYDEVGTPTYAPDLAHGIGQLIESENQTIFEELKKSYPDSYACSLKIADYLNRELHKQINDEEILYLVIHINRLISRIEE